MKIMSINRTFRIVLLGIALAIAGSAAAQYNEISCSKRPFTTRIVQVDQLENSTVFYFEYQNDGQRYMNVYEDIAVRDDHGNAYPLLNSYNMPLSDEDHSHQLVLTPNQEHRFALEFERVPLNNTLDIVESEGNLRALNFYEVVIDTINQVSRIDFDNWIKDYPVKEYGFYISDGESVQYMSYKGLVLSAHIQETKEYGHYYTIDLDVQNYSNKDVLLDPARITATSYIPKKKKEVDMKVLSAEDYDKRVKRSQRWSMALLVAAEVAVTAATIALESSDNDHHRNHHDHPGPPPRHHGWRPAHYSHHPYYPTDHYRSRYHSHEMGGIVTAASVALTMGVAQNQAEKREALQADYIKANSIKQGSEYMGYFHIKHEKTDNLVVSIPLMGETFDFHFQWQSKK
ncbi:MAG: hypothetical protein J6X70_05220 [Muribaculaceae bacterium]|nr:hypothetical protein [Muribaculaceae bacterium]